MVLDGLYALLIQLDKVMKLQVLPRAEQWFKQKIDLQIGRLIEESEDLSKKYLGKREEVVQKMSCGTKARRKIESLIIILEQALALSPQARAIMQEVKGMEVQEIEELLGQLRKLLQLAVQQASNTTQQNTDFEAGKLQDNDEQSITGMNEESFQEKDTTKNAYIGVALQALEAVCCTSSLIAIVYFASQHLLP